MENPNESGVLVIAAHPDDELLGCGGTLALHVDAGECVTVVIVCEGESLRYDGLEINQANFVRQAAEVLGVVQAVHLRWLAGWSMEQPDPHRIAAAVFEDQQRISRLAILPVNAAAILDRLQQ